MEVVVAVVIFTLLLYIPVELIKKRFNGPNKKGGFPYSRNRRGYRE